MKGDRDELFRRAREARADARARLGRLPEGAASATLALARTHPWLVTGAAFSLGFLGSISSIGTRGARVARARSARLGGLSSWALSLGALALRFLPGLLRVDAALRDRQHSG